LAKQQIAIDFVVGGSLDRMNDEPLNFGLQNSALPHFFHQHLGLRTFARLEQAQVTQINMMGSSKRHFS
jgi:hypothetical protein